MRVSRIDATRTSDEPAETTSASAPSSPRDPKWLVRALLLVVVAVAAAQVVFYFARTVDDMYISLRYAERLVAGDGLTFNDGQAVEGFSNPSWVLLQALLIGAGVDGLVATKLLSLASYLLLFWGLYRVGREALGLRPAFALAALGMVAATSYVASWAMWGLETPLYLALLVWMLVAFRRRLTEPRPSARTTALLAGTVVALLLTRPEAPLYVAGVALVSLLVSRPPDESGPGPRLDRFKRLFVPGAIAALVIGLLLVWRHAYFGQWLPQTYFAKQGEGFAIARWLPLVGQGAPPLEIVYVLGGLVLTGVVAVRLRAVDLLAVWGVNLFFIASVAADWMPNQRHFLPLFVLAPLPWAWLVQRVWTRGGATDERRLVHRLGGVVIAALLGVQAVSAFMIDARFSESDFHTHGRGETWIRPKNARTWRDALDALAREPPEHVAHMSVQRMGMIDQLFRVLEASARPERETWFIGRDIGRLGYLSPVQIYDTCALFTPALTASEAWLRDGSVAPALVDEAFALEPVGTDFQDSAWTAAVARRQDIVLRHDVLVGGPKSPVALRPKGLERPSPAEVLARYERVVEKFRVFFYSATLYGENVNAAIEKRYQWMRQQVRAADEVRVKTVPRGLAPAEASPAAARGVAVDRGRIVAHGCRVEPAPADADGTPALGDDLVLACYWEAKRRVTRDWDVFVHLVDAGGAMRMLADHAPVAGLHPTSRWMPGEIVRDAVVLTIPDELRGVELAARVGLYAGDVRAPAAQIEGAVDADGRLMGPTIGVAR